MFKQILENIQNYKKQDYARSPTVNKIKNLGEDVLEKFDLYAWDYGIKFNLGRPEFIEYGIEKYAGSQELVLDEILDYIPNHFGHYIIKEINYVERDYSDEYKENNNIYIYCMILLMEPKSRICFKFNFTRKFENNETKDEVIFPEECKYFHNLLYHYYKRKISFEEFKEGMDVGSDFEYKCLDFSYIYGENPINEKCLILNRYISKLYDSYRDFIDNFRYNDISEKFIVEYEKIMEFFKDVCIRGETISLDRIESIIIDLITIIQVIKDKNKIENDYYLNNLINSIETFIGDIQTEFVQHHS